MNKRLLLTFLILIILHIQKGYSQESQPPVITSFTVDSNNYTNWSVDNSGNFTEPNNSGVYSFRTN